MYTLSRLFLTARLFFRIARPGLYWKILLNGFRTALGLHYPASAVLGLTYSCQCKCVHCSAGRYAKKPQEELSTEEWFSLLDRIAETGAPRVNLSGGEALLRKDIFDIVRRASRNFTVVLESNGRLLDEGNVIRLKEAGISLIAVSIDSPVSSEHDGLRGLDGCYKDAVRGLESCVRHNVPCLISTYVCAERKSKENIDAIMALARRLRVDAVRVMPARPVGSFSCSTDSLLSPQDELDVMRAIDPSIAYFSGIPAPSSCGIFSRAIFYVSPYGEVQPCPYLPILFGSVRTESLQVILERMWTHSAFSVKKERCLALDADFRRKYIDASGKYPAEAPRR